MSELETFILNYPNQSFCIFYRLWGKSVITYSPIKQLVSKSTMESSVCSFQKFSQLHF